MSANAVGPAPITATEVAKRLAHIKTLPTSDAQGKAFEELAEYLFTALGCRTARDLASPLHTEQLDLVGVHLGALNPLPTFFIVECKWWAKKVDSKAVGYFVNICTDRGAKIAIIFARNGLTGSKKSQNAAHSVAFGAALKGVHLIVITESNIAGLTSNDDFANMLIDAWVKALAGVGVGLP